MEEDKCGLMYDQFTAFATKKGMKLSKGAKRLLTLPNAGGTSVYSEVMSFEVLSTLFHAKLECTEMELVYATGSKITDYSIRVRDQVIGVSVTRAMKFGGGEMTKEEAERLLTKKLYGVIDSTNGVIEEQKWKKQILHIFAENESIAKTMISTYHTLSDELKANTLVYVTIAKDSQWIFYEYM